RPIPAYSHKFGSGLSCRLPADPHLQKLDVINDFDAAFATECDYVRRIKISIHGAQYFGPSGDGGIDHRIIIGVGQHNRAEHHGSDKVSASAQKLDVFQDIVVR